MLCRHIVLIACNGFLIHTLHTLSFLGSLQVHQRPLYTWIVAQRKRYSQGRLEPDRWMRLNLLGDNVLGGKSAKTMTTPTNNLKRTRDYDDESMLASLPPPELNSAAACLLQMSRQKILIEDDDEDFEPEPLKIKLKLKPKSKKVESIITTVEAVKPNHKNLESITFPYCMACTSKPRTPLHHKMCPKNDCCNRDKLEKIVRGYNAGCAACIREFKFGSQTGRHEAHSSLCPRSSKFRVKTKKSSTRISSKRELQVTTVVTPAVVTPKTVMVTTRKTRKVKHALPKALPKKIFLPDMPSLDCADLAPPPLLFQKSVEIMPLPHEISPLITVDTFDLDALITDLQNGKASSTETLERLQKIRRTAL